MIEVFAFLREKLKWNKREVEFEGNSTRLGDILRKVPELYEVLIDENTGELKEGFIVLINGVHAQFLGGLNASVNDGDVICVFPPAAGG